MHCSEAISRPFFVEHVSPSLNIPFLGLFVPLYVALWIHVYLEESLNVLRKLAISQELGLDG